MFIKRIRSILTVLGILIVCVIVVMNVKNNSKQEETIMPSPLVKTLTIYTSNVAAGYSYPGVVRSQYENQLAFQVGGKIIKRYVDVGDTVKTGTILMQIDSKDLEQTVNNYAAQVSYAESKFNFAEDNLKRFTRLYEQQITSQAEYDNYVNLYNTAQAALDQSKALYEQSVNQLDYCKLTADRSGVIGSIDAEEGQIVSAGQKVGTLMQDNKLEVEINVPENRIDKMKNAKKINISFWALSNVEIKGILSEMSPIADAASRTYKVRVGLVNPPSAVKLGMSSTVNIDPYNSDEKIYIPLESIYQVSSSPAVWIVNDNKVSLKKIKVSEFSGNKVEVIDGLKEGDVIVIAGVHKLSEGQQVRTESGD